jgi:carbamoyl-phosphate synthase large subunit
MNIQYAIQNRTVYVLEVNPRASRTLPFVAKATGVPWADIATRAMLGQPLARVLEEFGIRETPWPQHVAIKAPVFPFKKFPGVDVILGPEMRSTGEVMAIAPTFGQAFAKAQIATGFSLPTSGNALVSVNDPDKPRIVSVARDLTTWVQDLLALGTRICWLGRHPPPCIQAFRSGRPLSQRPNRRRHAQPAD